jgi:L-cystine transport system ATP-binding protein
MSADVVLEGVVKRFGERTVLDGVDLHVTRGEVVALVGASGSGKSTLLRLVNGLEAHDAGRVEVLGFEAPRSSVPAPARERAWLPLRRRVGFVFQAFPLYPHRTALENLTLAPEKVLGRSREEAREKGLALLARVGLADRADAWPRELSGGQRQRVAIARALATDPEILLFDEPTSALDPETIGEVLAVVRDLAASHERTILVVTHEIHFARDVADRVAFLDDGRILEIGPARDVLTAPKEPRTREFLQRLT